MNTSFKTILRAGAAAVALALAGANASAVDLQKNLSIVDSVDSIVSTANNGAFGTSGGEYDNFAVVPVLWTVTYDSKTFLAFCIDPSVGLSGLKNDYSASTYVASDAIKRLYEHSYASSVADASVANSTASSAFQLALWELNNDNGAANGYASLLQGQMKFDNVVDDDTVAAANSMLLWAKSDATILNTYSYTSLNSNNAGFESQRLLAVSPVTAVPEAQTWAMLLAGLGLLGFMRRRKPA